MRERPLLTAGLVALLACACSDDPARSRDPLSPIAARSIGATNASKVNVCHRNGGDEFRLINVSANAVDAHVAHGDGLPGAPVPGDPSLKFDATCQLVNAVVCPCQFNVDAINALNSEYGDLGTDYDFLSTNVVTQIFSRSDIGDRRANRFVAFQAPGPDWPQFFGCVTRVYGPDFVIISNEEIQVTAEEAVACVDDLTTLATVLGAKGL